MISEKENAEAQSSQRSGLVDSFLANKVASYRKVQRRIHKTDYRFRLNKLDELLCKNVSATRLCRVDVLSVQPYPPRTIGRANVPAVARAFGYLKVKVRERS